MPWDRRKVHWLSESEWEKAIEALNEWCIVGCPDGYYLVLNPDYSVYVASGAETQLNEDRSRIRISACRGGSKTTRPLTDEQLAFLVKDFLAQDTMRRYKWFRDDSIWVRGQFYSY